ncbi:MAG: tyrosine decarboxylase/aspartate 1-decarboxylase [Arcticibacterium sp.]|jgi:tyrosine decarboxylase/aspartate 1-decarboxylase
MNTYWKKKSQEEIKSRVFSALAQNINYKEESLLGMPATHLDEKVFNQDASFLKDAPFITSLVQNPNHIGCHTLGKSESAFSGTHEIEKELIEICSVDILKGEPLQNDGYIASGGTEGNIQAIWIYRNYFMAEENADRDEICIICSEDSHYSMYKAGNLLSVPVYKVPVGQDDRQITEAGLSKVLIQAKKDGKKYFIVVCNMMTTMFGSVDEVDDFVKPLEALNCTYKLHVDGAYGGFYYPFSDENSQLTFKNEKITSFSLDAHKMAQAPYGTGVFMIRKGFMKYANTEEASYVEGEDFTLIGSRSGANVIATWMILSKHGPYGWSEKVYILQRRTQWLCEHLANLGLEYYRHPMSNIVTIKNHSIDSEVAKRFGLVPDNHKNPKWLKIVVMEHVTIEKLMLLLDAIKNSQPELVL